MRKLNNILLTLLLLTLTTTINYFEARAQSAPSRVSDQNVQLVLTRLETRTDRFKRSMNKALDRSKYNGTDTEDNIFEYITEFENATDKLKQRFDANESVSSDVTDVLNRAVFIESFLKRNSLTSRVQRTWARIKSDLDTLSGFYNVNYDWNAALSGGGQVYTKPYRVSDNSVKTLLTRIETRTDNYKRRMNTALDRSTLNNTDKEDMVFAYITEFENATDRLKQRFDAKESVSADVRNVLSRAASIDHFMRNNRLTRSSERSWRNLRIDLNTLASYYNLTFDWTKQPVSDQVAAYTVAGSRVSNLLNRLETKTDNYKDAMDRALDRSVLNNTRSEDAILAYITEFENATDKLKQRFDAKESTDKNVLDVLNRAAYIDTFMRDYRLLRSAENQWTSIRTDLNTLSNFYAVNFDWNRQFEPVSKFDSMLTGTYRINRALSDDVAVVVKNAIEIYPTWEERSVERKLTRRLSSPDVIVISKNANNVMVASSNAPQVMFKTDGVARSETAPNGMTVNVTAKSYYDGVALSYEGERANDFYVNFMPLANNRLKIVRRIKVEDPAETITVAAVYDKIEQATRWEMARNDSAAAERTTATDNGFVVPNKTPIEAVMRTTVSTKASQNGDRFQMEVLSPSIYQGAIIEGRVVKAKRSGIFSGRATVSLDFDTITLQNGSTYKFAGLIENVKLASGENVTVSNEGQVRDNNQTSKTVKRAGIGAGVGAIIGAILGGGDGAAIGAAIGGSAGAGTVVAQGRDDVEMEAGTTLEITATAPANNSTGSPR
ncbi:MAG: glycine zipper family protein [Pyrinomonadaceae bacterium]|nr:glycine zipper family protein [Pyrinomonadaceae bacterium]